MAKKKKKTRDVYDDVKGAIQLMVAGDFPAALNAASEILNRDPGRPEGYFVLALIAYKQGDEGRAIELFNSAHSRDPDCREYADALAVLYTLNGKLTDGLYFAKLATALDSNAKMQALLPPQMSEYFTALSAARPSLHYVRALAAFNARKFENVVEECEREIRVNKYHADACRLLARASLELSNYDRADEAIKAAVAVAPDQAKNFLVLGDTLMHLGDFPKAVEAFKVALDRDTESAGIATSTINGTRFLDDDMIAVQSDFRDEIERRVAALPRNDDRSLLRPTSDESGLTRIGYLSNTLFDSDLGIRIQTLLSFHNRRKFEIYIYQASVARDSVNVEITGRANSHRNIYDLDDDVATTIIGNDQIDILVDLCGYSEENRLGIIARRAAPVQIGYMQYPHGFAVPGVNFVLSDPITLESDQKNLGEGQQALLMDFGMVAVSPFSVMQNVQALPAKSKGHVTFGGLADPAYLSPATVAAWVGVLDAVPHARLLLGNVRAVSPMTRDWIGRQFAIHGAGDRIDFFESPGPRLDRQAFYHRIDGLLDTFPVSGESSICEALWMGAPVVSLMGPRRTSQMGVSILHSAGKPEWACSTAQQFVDAAASLAADVGRLATIRTGLRHEVAGSALFSPGAMISSLEAAYMQALGQVRGGKA